VKVVKPKWKTPVQMNVYIRFIYPQKNKKNGEREMRIVTKFSKRDVLRI
jgi:hypothetical protein